MRSTSSGSRRTLAALLCLALLLPPAAVRAAPPEGGGEGALLLRYASPGLDPAAAASTGDGLRTSLSASLAVRWLPLPRREPPSPLPGGRGAEPSPDDLARIAGRIRDAAALMERAEGAEAEAALAAAEEEGRRHAGSPSVLPYLADIQLRRAVLALWGGDGAGARRRLAAVRTLSPSFAPEPALFSPAVREAWDASAAQAPLPARLLVESVPSGAEVRLDGAVVGRTPASIAVAGPGRHRVLLALPGHVATHRDGAWLPGDEPSISLTLPPDPLSALPQNLPAEGEGIPPALPALLSAVADEAGASRICLAVLVPAGEGRPRARLLSWTRGEGVRDLGVPGDAAEGGRGSAAGADAGRLLVAAGWPAAPGGGDERPWYHRWWFYAAVGAVAAGAAAIAAGGGGGGSSTAAVRVNF